MTTTDAQVILIPRRGGRKDALIEDALVTMMVRDPDMQVDVDAMGWREHRAAQDRVDRARARCHKARKPSSKL